MLKMLSHIVEILGQKTVNMFSVQGSHTSFLQTYSNTKDLSPPREYFMQLDLSWANTYSAKSMSLSGSGAAG